MANLFAAAASIGPKPLISFRAGKMQKDGKAVKADKRKGLLQLTQGEDMLLHFQWKDRYTGQMEDDLIIFPGEATFSRVDKCTTGRVFVLDFKGTNRQLLFWMQEPKTDSDEEHCKKINEFITSPPRQRLGEPVSTQATAPPAAALAPSGNPPAGASGLSRDQLLSMLTQAQGNQAPSPQPASQFIPPVTQPTTTVARQNPIELATLQSILAGFGGPVGLPQPPLLQQQVPEVDLAHVLNAQELSPLVQQHITEFASELAPHLPPIPDGISSEQHLMDNLRSSQLQQTVSLFQSALEDPQAYHEITTAFGFRTAPPAAGTMAPFGTQPFLEAISNTYPPAQGGDTPMEGTAERTQGEPQSATAPTTQSPKKEDPMDKD
jgi:26S proteasome regulatory subunit N13